MNIDLSEYDIPTGTGQWSYNHKGCPAGVDTKKRLYIKVISNGNIIAYCHHCGNKGFRFATFGKYARASDSMHPVDMGSIRHPGEAPKDLTTEFPPHALAYLSQYGIDVSKGGFHYSPSEDAVVMFASHVVGHSSGFTMRHLSGPRRYTSGIGATGSTNYPAVVFCEDFISAVRMDWCPAGVKGIPLYGTTTANLPTLGKGVLQCFVWLDEDLAGNKGTVDVVRHLQQLGHSPIPIYAPQPKNLTDAEIIEVIKKAKNGRHITPPHSS